ETEFGIRITNEIQGIIEIYDLNKKGLGVGCDFQIRINEDVVEYIEVKSKVEANPSFVEMTSAQWNLAQQEKDKYWIYVVYNSGNEDFGIITIKNPFAHWENGNLLAQVVRIKLHKSII
ncbi:MAG TPA: DUF3883 domain-containing protein, partial [Pyrinomonadaceae bacterium]|nr:DUF3883 domain-containing protein [Pyrinomonadaceae bacterium]